MRYRRFYSRRTQRHFQLMMVGPGLYRFRDRVWNEKYLAALGLYPSQETRPPVTAPTTVPEATPSPENLSPTADDFAHDFNPTPAVVDVSEPSTQSEPAQSDPIQSDVAQSEPAQSEPGQSDPIQSDVAQSEPTLVGAAGSS